MFARIVRIHGRNVWPNNTHIIFKMQLFSRIVIIHWKNVWFLIRLFCDALSVLFVAFKFTDFKECKLPYKTNVILTNLNFFCVCSDFRELLKFIGNMNAFWYESCDFRIYKKWSKFQFIWFLFAHFNVFCNDVGICCWQRGTELMVRKVHFHDFRASRWGGVKKMKKQSPSRWGGVANCVISTPTLHGKQKKTTPMQHGNAKSCFCDTSSARMLVWKFINFCCCGFLWIWGGKKVARMGQPVRFFIFVKIIRNLKKCKKSKCC